MRKNGLANWPEVVLLDLDGTLVDSENLQIEAIAQCLRERGIEINEDERNFAVGRAWQEIHTHLKVAERAGLALPAFRQAAWSQLLDLEAKGWEISILPGAKTIFTKLRDWEMPTAIVSGSTRKEIERCLRVLDESKAEFPDNGVCPKAASITEQLSFFLGAEDYRYGKPDPSAYLLAAKRFGVSAEQCLVVEDSEVGIAAARSAKMAVVGSAAARAVQVNPKVQRLAHVVIDSLLDFDQSIVEQTMKIAKGVRDEA